MTHPTQRRPPGHRGPGSEFDPPELRTDPLPLPLALLPVATMLLLFAAGVILLGSSTELLIGVLLGAAAVAGGVARRQGRGWDDVQRATGEKLAAVLPALLILLSIGMLIGAWVLSGTIPFLVYWGVRLVNPQYLVLTAFLATALMSTVTGTSWGSAGTIGVALMGTAAALDAPLAATAGAVVSGAYFGDKLSPLSDSTNISAIGAAAPLYTHIRHMLWTALPSFAVALVVYTALAWSANSGAAGMPDAARTLLADIDSVFRLGWYVLLPPAVVIWGIVRRVPPALAISLSALTAAAIGVAVQPFGAQDALGAAVTGFRLEMIDAGAAGPGTGTDFQRLVQRGGLYSMAPTLVVIIAAFLLAAGMQVAGALDAIMQALLRGARSVFRLVAATMAAGASMIALTSHGGVTALVVGGMFQQAYRERGLAPENLSRSIEDSVTITEPLMPWTVSAVFMATTLGVPTLAYAPWAVFCYGGPFFSMVVAAAYARTGIGLRKTG